MVFACKANADVPKNEHKNGRRTFRMRIHHSLAGAVANGVCTPATAVGARLPAMVVMAGTRFAKLVGTSFENNRHGVEHFTANATIPRRSP